LHLLFVTEQIGISLNTRWFEPDDCTSAKDAEATETSFQFANYWFLNPLLGEKGGYPEIMKVNIGSKCSQQRFKNSSLPSFSLEEFELVRKSLDFIGLSFYTTYSVRSISLNSQKKYVFKDDDMSAKWLPYIEAYGAFDIKV
jgi:beta-glucosidase/6-phospho-beta-glucosidase/beta-galactosidase